MFWRQFKIAWLPFIAAVFCASIAVVHHGTAEGSAASGHIDNGRYFLSLGHGAYQETSPERFHVIQRDERISVLSLAATVIFTLFAAYRIYHAGLPLRKQDILPTPTTLRPRL